MVRVLFVCLGNICRSPTAEAVLRSMLEREGLGDAVEVDSAGTGSWHAGAAPDPRSTAAAARRGIALGGAARQVEQLDLDAFDLVLAMDFANRDDLLALAGEHPGRRAKIRLLREFDPAAVEASTLDVPDPYQGGPEGFEHVLDVVEAACAGLVAELRSHRVA